jgi:broad specificity phosphatase PhoE
MNSKEFSSQAFLSHVRRLLQSHVKWPQFCSNLVHPASLRHDEEQRSTMDLADPSVHCPTRNRESSHPGESKTRMIMIRHGHVAANGGDPDAPMAGWTDVALSPRGRLQIEQLRRHLVRRPAFDAIYSSPLSRASETAQSLFDAGLGSLHFYPTLKEINCGEVDGLPVREVQHRYPELWRENLRQVREDFRWPGGESYCEFRDRCVAAVQSIAASHSSGYVAVVTHAGVINQIVGSIHGLSPACWDSFRPGNASISELVWRDSRGTIASFDCRLHLSGAE